MEKKWYLSKTLWFNTLSIVLGTVEIVNGYYPVPVELLALGTGMINLLLRFLTTKKVTV